MSDKARFTDGSIAQVGRVFLGLIALCLVVAGSSALGLPDRAAVAIFLTAGIALCALRPDAEAKPSVRAVSISVESVSAFGFFGIAGAVFVYGHDGLSVLVGLAAGLVISLLLIVPRLAASPARSFPDYLSLRYRSDAVRYCALAVMTIVTLLFVAAQLAAAGVVAELGIGIPRELGALVCAIIALALTLRGGDAGQVVLALAVVFGIAIATTWLLSMKTGIVVPHVAYGGLFEDIAGAEAQLGALDQAGLSFAHLGLSGFMAMVLCLGIGSAVMPSLIARAWTPGSPAQTQTALRRGLVLFVLVATALPALGVLARSEVLTQMVAGAEGQSVELSLAALAVAALTGASAWLVGLLSLVGLSLAILGASAATRSMASLYSTRSPEADRAGRISISAIILVLLALGLSTAADVFMLGLLAFSLSGASIFAPLALGLVWQRATKQGALAGMLGGFAMTMFYAVGAGWGLEAAAASGDGWSWLGVPGALAGGFGIVASMLLTVAISIATTKPRPEPVALPE